jgi:SAM-dependent methyltransferase
VLLKSTFNPPTNFASDSFDAIVILATMEHILDPDSIAMECARILRPAGRAIITVPSPLVDQIIDILVRIRILDGMSMEEHHGFQPSHLPHIFHKASLSLLTWRRFQLGLNNLFVFEKKG